MPKTSGVWIYFIVCNPDESKVECQLCDKKFAGRFLSRGNNKSSYSTKPLWNHLKSKHGKEQKVPNKTEINCTTVQGGEMEDEFESIPSTSKSELKSGIGLQSLHSQLSIEESFARLKKWDLNDPRAKEVTNLICKVMALDAEPYRIVEREGFGELIKFAFPRYPLPSRTYFSKIAMPEIFNILKKQIIEKLSTAAKISFSTDIWTCEVNNDSFISLSAHFISKSASMKSEILTLSSKHLSEIYCEKHTAEAIAILLKKTLEEFQINDEQLHVLVTDNAANIVLGTRNLSPGFMEGIPCFIHCLQLCINDALFNQRCVSDILANCREIASFFNKSIPSYNRLQEIQSNLNLPKHKIIEDVTTRWNSTYYMLQRIYEQRRAIDEYATKCDDIPMFKGSEWGVIEDLIRVLQPFEEITKQASADEEVISFVIPAVKTLMQYLTKRHLDEGVQTMREELRKSMSKIFLVDLQIEEKKSYVIATLLDPRYKNFFSDNKERDTSWLLQEMISYCKKDDDSASEDKLNNPIGRISKGISDITEDAHEDFWRNFDEIIETKRGIKRERSYEDNDTMEEISVSLLSYGLEDRQSKESYTLLQGDNEELADLSSREMLENTRLSKLRKECKSELEFFLNLPLISRNKKCIDWWANNGDQFPHMQPLVLQYLSAPPSSVFSERLFSAAGRIYAGNRNFLDPNNAELLLFILKNMKLWEQKRIVDAADNK